MAFPSWRRINFNEWLDIAQLRRNARLRRHRRTDADRREPLVVRSGRRLPVVAQCVDADEFAFGKRPDGELGPVRRSKQYLLHRHRRVDQTAVSANQRKWLPPDREANVTRA